MGGMAHSLDLTRHSSHPQIWEDAMELACLSSLGLLRVSSDAKGSEELDINPNDPETKGSVTTM
jgi:hypothetical protein